MLVQLYETHHGDCPYLPDRQWVTRSFSTPSMPENLYEGMLGDRWRRSGHTFYQNHCPGCTCCTPVRVPVDAYRPSRSQRRAINRNSDLVVDVVAPTADAEAFDLYRRYVTARHPRSVVTEASAFDEESPEQFDEFLVRAPLETRAMTYRLEGRLVGIGWIDVLPNGLSSVYFAFDPAESRRSLGTYSITREIELARDLGKQWLYLGFYVPGSQKMEYKGAFHPREFAVDERWSGDETQIRCSGS